MFTLFSEVADDSVDDKLRIIWEFGDGLVGTGLIRIQCRWYASLLELCRDRSHKRRMVRDKKPIAWITRSELGLVCMPLWVVGVLNACTVVIAELFVKFCDAVITLKWVVSRLIAVITGLCLIDCPQMGLRDLFKFWKITDISEAVQDRDSYNGRLIGNNIWFIK